MVQQRKWHSVVKRALICGDLLWISISVAKNYLEDLVTISL